MIKINKRISPEEIIKIIWNEEVQSLWQKIKSNLTLAYLDRNMVWNKPATIKKLKSLGFSKNEIKKIAGHFASASRIVWKSVQNKINKTGENPEKWQISYEPKIEGKWSFSGYDHWWEQWRDEEIDHEPKVKKLFLYKLKKSF